MRPDTLSAVTPGSRRLLGSALVSGLLVLLAPLPAVAAAPAGAHGATAAPAGARGATAADPAVCALPDRTPVPVPTPSPLPTHDPGAPVVGGGDLGGNGLAVPTGAPAPPGTTATSWLVADLDTGEIVGACGAHRYGAPASLQKLLLVETVLPRLKPTDLTTITPEDLDFEPGSSAVGLLLGGEYSVETLFLGLMLNSGNDAANTLARLGSNGHGVRGTLDDMNVEAKRLGAWDTHAETPSGLDGPGQVTSAYDLALIFRACFGFDDFRRYVGTRTAQMPAQPVRNAEGYQIQNDNRLLFEYPGALGGKTGFTDIARHTYVGAAERDGRRLVVSVLGAEVMPLRAWQQGAALLDWGFSVTKGASVGHLVAPGEADKLLVTAEPSAPVVVPAAAAPAATTEPHRGLMLVAVGAGAAAFAGIWVFTLMLARRGRATHRQWRSPAGDTTVAITPVPSTVEPAAAAQPSTVEAATAVAVLDEPAPRAAKAPPAPLMGQPPPPPEA
jgi:D-alanyl-D-alanine carboxypeptidase (penicillin-binding protein 5/6)